MVDPPDKERKVVTDREGLIAIVDDEGTSGLNMSIVEYLSSRLHSPKGKFKVTYTTTKPLIS